MGTLDTKLFPGVSSSVQVHGGFRDEHEKTALIILTEVKRLMSVTGSKSVVAVRFSKFSFFSDCIQPDLIGRSFPRWRIGGARFIILDLESSFHFVDKSSNVWNTTSRKCGICSTD
jgi:hypothetical protein